MFAHSELWGVFCTEDSGEGIIGVDESLQRPVMDDGKVRDGCQSFGMNSRRTPNATCDVRNLPADIQYDLGTRFCSESHRLRSPLVHLHFGLPCSFLEHPTTPRDGYVIQLRKSMLRLHISTS